VASLGKLTNAYHLIDSKGALNGELNLQLSWRPVRVAKPVHLSPPSLVLTCGP
jgi:hypothetical protein